MKHAPLGLHIKDETILKILEISETLQSGLRFYDKYVFNIRNGFPVYVLEDPFYNRGDKELPEWLRLYHYFPAIEGSIFITSKSLCNGTLMEMGNIRISEYKKQIELMMETI